LKDGRRIAVSAARLLNAGDIPTSLWDREQGILHLPQSLADAYTRIIDGSGLRELAASRDRADPPVGGLTQQLADAHFAQAFDGSAARALLALLDPYDHLTNVSNTFINALAGNRLCVIDAPCGAGATAYAFLTAIADLRKFRILPRVPMDVTLIGADLSAPARLHASNLFPILRQPLEEQAIFVSAEFHSWDATDKMSTTSLIRRSIELSPNGMRRLVLVANFSGFLERQGKRGAAEPQLEELFRYTSGPNCASLWIEPNMNRATSSSGTFAWLAAKAKQAWRRFVSVIGGSDGAPSYFTSSACFREPLDAAVTPNVRIAVMPMILEHRE
jgi:hypothetical protein